MPDQGKPICPRCSSPGTVKAGRTTTGSQRMRCKACDHPWTAEPKKRGRKPPYEGGHVVATLRLYKPHQEILKDFPGKNLPEKLISCIMSKN